MQTRLLASSLCAVGALLGSSVRSFAQAAASNPTSPAAASAAAASGTTVLSPFTVSTTKDVGYLASSTLAGSRLNTSLYDTPASISVMTKEFLDDIGATSIAETLQYSVNAEVDRSDSTGNPGTAGDLPLTIRGFSGSSLGRNYFQWGLESDTYNTERIDFSRGPNSILFGTGAPGGIINTTTKRAEFGREIRAMQLRVGAWDDYRAAIDVGRQLGRRFAVRLNLLAHDRGSWRDFVESERRGAAFAASYRPFGNTEIRLDAEHGNFDRVTSNAYLPGDSVTPWIAAGRPLAATAGAAAAGTGPNNARALVYDETAGTVLSWFGTRLSNGPGAAPSSSAQRALTDFSILPLAANLPGDGNRNDSEFTATGLFIEQRFGPLAIEAAANRQKTKRLWLSTYGFAEIMLRADPNALLPDGRPNPNAGRYFIEGNAQRQDTDAITDDFRFTAAYDLDLTRHNPWFGRWQVAGLASRRRNDTDNDTLVEVNSTPAGTALYPADLTNINNRINRRVYIDPLGPGRRGGRSALAAPIDVGGVRSAFVRVANQGTVSREILETTMIAGQTKLLKDRLVLTGGIRRDEQRNFAGTATQAPGTRLFSFQTLNPRSTDFAGQTKTYGAVLHATTWASVFYNKSNNFSPQSTLTINGNELGPRRGVGEDYGVKFRLFDGKAYVNLTRYKTSEVNRLTFASGILINVVNEVYEAIGDPTRVAGPTSRDGIDTEGEGYEFELTANPTRQWRFTLNASRTLGTQSNNQPRNQAYIETRRTGWLAQGSRPLIAPFAAGVPTVGTNGGVPTVADALATLDDQIRSILGANGVSRRQLREYNASGFSAYTFRSEAKWLDGLTAGGGFRYRGEPVIGYGPDGKTPFYGDDEIYLNAMLAKPVTVFGRRVRLQANFENILDADDIIAVDGNASGNYRFLYPDPFRWMLSANVTF